MASKASKAAPEERGGGGYGKGQFKPVEFDASEIMPDADPGKYGLKIGAVKVKPHGDTQYPMMIIEFDLEKAYEEENEKFVGGNVSTFIVMYPDNDRRGNFMKQRLQELCDAIDVDIKLIPKRITKDKDLKPFIDALKSKRVDGWISHREVNGQNRVNVDFNDPDAEPEAGYQEEEEEENDNEPVRPAKRSKARR